MKLKSILLVKKFRSFFRQDWFFQILFMLTFFLLGLARMAVLIDVSVDIRKGSPTFGQWIGVYLSADNKRQLWIPDGFAHGFYVTSNQAEFIYKCTDYYCPESEVSIA